MRKLNMDVDALRVESFVADEQAPEGGTVHGRSAPFDQDPGSTDCDGAGWWSLFGTCAGCPTVGTCIGPTYCCQPTWKPTCDPSCTMSCDGKECPI